MTINNFDKTEYFNHLLPYLSKYRGSIFVIKYGGSAMSDTLNMTYVVNNILLLYYLGIKPVLVHGGGPIINYWLNRVSIVPKFHNGLRITNRDTMDVVEMVLAGKVNKKIVALLNIDNHDIAVGLSGIDSSCIYSAPLFNVQDNYVGRVERINAKIFNLLLDNNYIPVISSLGMDAKGYSYNINADTVAGAIAGSLKADRLLLLTDTDGIMRDINDISSRVTNLNVNDIISLKSEGIIAGGMLPKVDSCISALEQGVSSAHIINGKTKNALLQEIFTSEGIGSCIKL